MLRHLISCVLLLSFSSPLFADTSLSSIIPDGEWELAADKLGFTDGLATDKDGNLYFSDLRSKPAAIYKISPDGTKTKVADANRSGLKLGPDGRLYGCGNKQIAAYDLATGKETILAENLQPNDLAISAAGRIYFTETGKKQITLFDIKTKETKAVDTGTVNRPNGIALSPDQQTLYVSDHGGTSVWAFTVKEDGTLSDKKALMTMKAPEKTPTVASGDGMTTDSAGRAYVTTSLGLQIFDKSGQLLGVLPKPTPVNPVSAGFAGPNHDILYLACGDKLYRRKTNAKGALTFIAPTN
jgi:enterochelin esterase family protein